MSTYFSYKKPQDLRVGDTVWKTHEHQFSFQKLRVREFYPKSGQVLLENTERENEFMEIVFPFDIKQLPPNE